jgi:hypothetical protein
MDITAMVHRLCQIVSEQAAQLDAQTGNRRLNEMIVENRQLKVTGCNCGRVI